MGRRRRRSWSDAEKRRIVVQSYAPGASVSAVARRHEVSASLLCTWRGDPRYKPSADAGQVPLFLPVEVLPGPPHAEAGEASPGRIEIELSTGHRVSVSGSFDAEVLCRVVGALSG